MLLWKGQLEEQARSEGITVKPKSNHARGIDTSRLFGSCCCLQRAHACCQCHTPCQQRPSAPFIFTFCIIFSHLVFTSSYPSNTLHWQQLHRLWKLSICQYCSTHHANVKIFIIYKQLMITRNFFTDQERANSCYVNSKSRIQNIEYLYKQILRFINAKKSGL